MAKSQLFKPPVLDFIINHGGVFPVRRGPARPGGLHHRPHDLRPGRHGADVRRGRALAHQGARRAQARPRPARARVGRAGRAGRDPRLRARAGGEAAAAPEGDGPVRRAAHVRARSTTRHASSRRRSPSRSSTACATMYEALDAAGTRAACSRACAASAATALPRRAEPRLQPFLRTCQSHGHLGDRLAVRVGQLDLDRELDLAVRVEALEQRLLALAQRAGCGDRPLRQLQVGDLGGAREGRDLAHALGERAHEGGAGGRLAGREQRAGVLRADVVVQLARRRAGAPRRGRRRPRPRSRPMWRLKGIACSSPCATAS